MWYLYYTNIFIKLKNLYKNLYKFVQILKNLYKTEKYVSSYDVFTIPISL